VEEYTIRVYSKINKTGPSLLSFCSIIIVMVSELIGITIGVAIAILVMVIIFSLMPTLFENTTCPDPANLTDAGAKAWANSCADLKTQSAIIPTVLGLAVIIAVILVIPRLFSGNGAA
jgi:uncharacterized oligopeptide transporter (OPT) family protein